MRGIVKYEPLLLIKVSVIYMRFIRTTNWVRDETRKQIQETRGKHEAK